MIEKLDKCILHATQVVLKIYRAKQGRFIILRAK